MKKNDYLEHQAAMRVEYKTGDRVVSVHGMHGVVTGVRSDEAMRRLSKSQHVGHSRLCGKYRVLWASGSESYRPAYALRHVES